MGKILGITERIIVSVDYYSDHPGCTGRIRDVERGVLRLAKSLEGTGVYVRLGSILRAVGYHGLIEKIHAMGLKVFAELNLIGTPDVMYRDAWMSVDARPDILTVMCCAGIDGMSCIKKAFNVAGTEVVGVAVPEGFDNAECKAIFGRSHRFVFCQFARMAKLAGFNGLMLSTKEIGFFEKYTDLNNLTLNVSGVRPECMGRNDQTVTVEEAIMAGADRVIIDESIISATNPKKALQDTSMEITSALSRRER